MLRWPVTGVFIVNETLNETRRNTQKLFSHHEETVLQKLFYKLQKTVRPSGEEGLVRGRRAGTVQDYSRTECVWTYMYGARQTTWKAS
jgi:hypothetical protein